MYCTVLQAVCEVGAVSGVFPYLLLITLKFFVSCILHQPIPMAERIEVGSVADRLLGLRVRIPPGGYRCLSLVSVVLSGGGLCDGPVSRPEESYQLWRV